MSVPAPLRAALLASLLSLLSCSDSATPLPFEPEPHMSWQTSDPGLMPDPSEAGVEIVEVPGFGFLEPLTRGLEVTGHHDPSREPTVEICRLAGTTCGEIVGRWETGPHGPRHGVAAWPDHYETQVGMDELGVAPLEPLRLRVLLDGAVVGRVDVMLWNMHGELWAIDTDRYLPVFYYLLLPVRFRIEEGIALPPAGQPDLGVTALRIPATAEPGVPFPVEVDVANAGEADAPPTEVLVRVLAAAAPPPAGTAGAATSALASPVAEIGATPAPDTPVGAEVASATVPLGALAAGTTATVGTEFTVDAAWPAYVVVEATADAGGALGEPDESDNTGTSTVVMVARPDLVVEALAPSTDVVVLQCTLDISATVRNAGARTAAATDLVVSLVNPTDGSVVERRTLAQDALDPGAETPVLETFTAGPSWPDALILRVETDASGSVDEGDESNNVGEASSPTRAVVRPPSGFTKLWACGVDDAWARNENWSPVGAPTDTDDVWVPGGTPFAPRLTGNVSVGGLTVEPGASLEAGGWRVTASGDVAMSAMNGTGKLVMTGAETTLQGVFPRLDVVGTLRLSGATRVEGTVTLFRGGGLVVAGQRLEATGSLVVDFDDGVADGLVMTDPADEVHVGGNARFRTFAGGATSASSFTAGTLRIGGDFSAQARPGAGRQVFASRGTAVVMDGTTDQLIALNANAAGRSELVDLRIENTGGIVRVAGELHVNGLLQMSAGAQLEDPQGQGIYFWNRLPAVSDGYRVPETHVAGDIVMDDDFTLPGNGNMRIERGGRLTLAGHTARVPGRFLVQFDDGSSDGLDMSDPADQMIVGGDAVFRGFTPTASTRRLSAGTLRIGGDFIAIPSGANDSKEAFAPTGAGTTVRLDGSVPQGIALGRDSHVVDIVIENTHPEGVRLSRDLHVRGQMTLVGGAVFHNLGQPDHDPYFYTRMPIVGPGYEIEQTRIVGPVVMDRDVVMGHPRANLVIDRGGTLRLNGFRLEVARNVVVNLYDGGEGILMQSPTDVLDVVGKLDYRGQGGTSVGQLTDGTILLRGDFVHQRISGDEREIFAATGTTVVFAGDGTIQNISGHTPQTVNGDGEIVPGSRFSDMVIAEGAYVRFGLSSFASTSATWITGTADWAGTIERADSDLGTWVVAGTLILRPTLSGFSNAPICYGVLVPEGGMVGHTTTRESWTPLQALGGGDCTKG